MAPGRIFIPTGIASRESPFDRDQLDGAERSWYENGQLQSLDEFSHGVRHGVSAEWDENGKLKSEHHYENGKLLP